MVVPGLPPIGGRAHLHVMPALPSVAVVIIVEEEVIPVTSAEIVAVEAMAVEAMAVEAMAVEAMQGVILLSIVVLPLPAAIFRMPPASVIAHVRMSVPRSA